ncbi:MAG: hypothetical protein MUF52_01985 [Syntrophobacteraceae bacterium]|nr:hypothetical protein [Syntrophobacteraceae bacterium]
MPDPRPRAGRQGRLSRLWRLGQKPSVGIDLGATRMRLVKVAQASDQGWQVLASEIIPYRPSESLHSASFAEFLGEKIQDFAGPLKHVDLWAGVPPTHLDVRVLLIPKVPRKQLHDAVYWTARKDAALDGQESLLDFEVQGEVSDRGIPKLAVLTYTIPRQEVRNARELFDRSGLRLKGLSSAPFALQNLFKTGWIPVTDQVTASLYIGNDYSRIDIFNGDRLVFTRGIKAGVKSMQDAVWEAVSEQGRSLAVFSIDELSVPSILEEQAHAHRERADALLLSILSGSHDLEHPDPGLSITEQDALRMIRPPLERIIRQVEMTFKHFTAGKQDEVITMIHVHSSVVIGGLVISMIGDQLGIASEAVDPFLSGRTVTVETHGQPPPSPRAAMTTALGLAMSDNSRTPNFLFTHEDREEEARVIRINRATFTVFLILAIFCMTVFVHLGNLSRQKRAEIARLNDSLQSSPLVNETLVAQLASRVQQRQLLLKEGIGSLASVAVLGELSHLTPPNVRLMGVSANLKGSDGKDKGRSLTLEGIVRGDPRAVEASLAGYVKKLSGSPILRNPQVQNSSFKSFQGEGEVLHFVLRLELS